MRPTPTAVVGVGRLGAEHARVLSELPESRLVGVHDRRPERAESVASRVGARAFPRPDALLAEAEAVVVAVPTRAHGEVGRSVLEAGCHLLVEKPLAPTLEEADRLTAAAEARGRLACVGRVERFNPAVRAARRYLDGPRLLVAERTAPFRNRGGDVGVVLDLMIHDLDLALAMVDAPVRGVEAVGVSALTDAVDLANARVSFEDGTVAQITASRVSDEQVRRLRAYQENGCLSLDLAAGEGEFLHRRRARMPAGATDRLREAAERESIGGGGHEPLRLEVRGFLRRVRGEGGEAVTTREARRALELALRITREIEEPSHVPA